MKKIVIFLLVILGSAVFVEVKADAPIQVYDGTTLSIGDTIRIGYRQWINTFYSKIKEPLTDYKSEKYLNVRQDLSLVPVIVCAFNPQGSENIFNPECTVVVVRTPLHPKELYIDINEAIKRGEIAWIYKDHASDDAVELTDELAFVAYMRANKGSITDKVIKTFISIRDKKLYTACIGDEFEYYKAKPKYEQLLKNEISEFDFSKTYYIKHSVVIGEYNFKDNNYPISFGDRYISWHTNYLLEPTNVDKFATIPISFKEGERINRLRKGASDKGYVFSSAYGRIYMKLRDKSMSVTRVKEWFPVDFFYYLSVELEKIEVYGYNHCDYNFIGER